MMSEAAKDTNPRSKLTVLKPAEVERCFDFILDTQHRAIFMMIVELGMTPGEMLGDENLGIRGIYVQDINSDERTMKVQSRFRKEDRVATRVVPLTNSTLVAVRDYLASKNLSLHSTGKLFDISERMVRQFIENVEKQMNIDKTIDTATLRRTAIVKMLRAGLKPEEVERRLGFIRPQETPILIVSAMLMPDMEDYRSIYRDFLFDNLDVISNGVQAQK